MKSHPPFRFWCEATLACLAGSLVLLTATFPDWIETVVGLDPDQHSGKVEWLIAGVLLVIAAVFSRMARSTKRSSTVTQEDGAAT